MLVRRKLNNKRKITALFKKKNFETQTNLVELTYIHWLPIILILAQKKKMFDNHLKPMFFNNFDEERITLISFPRRPKKVSLANPKFSILYKASDRLLLQGKIEVRLN